jgi:beta-glucanase (GH16 family)
MKTFFMKTSTSFSFSGFFIAGACLISLGSCKKLSTSDAHNQTKAEFVNPNTAHVVCDYNFNDTTLTKSGWIKTFEDNFDSDLSNWSVLTGGVQNELQCNEPGNVQIVNGVLQITSKKESVTGPKTLNNDTLKSFDYTSGWIVDKKPISISDATPRMRIVARIKIASGYGLTSRFLSYGNNWPTGGEIDYLQVRGDDTKRYATDYYYGTTTGKNLVTNAVLYNPADADLSACYHVYEMEWSKNALTSYLDGQLVETKTSGGYISDLAGKNEFISFSLPIGGLYYNNLNTANIQTGTMYVDYVKVFTSK